MSPAEDGTLHSGREVVVPTPIPQGRGEKPSSKPESLGRRIKRGLGFWTVNDHFTLRKNEAQKEGDEDEHECTTQKTPCE